jgi:hypothetical protein
MVGEWRLPQGVWLQPEQRQVARPSAPSQGLQDKDPRPESERREVIGLSDRGSPPAGDKTVVQWLWR